MSVDLSIKAVLRRKHMLYCSLRSTIIFLCRFSDKGVECEGAFAFLTTERLEETPIGQDFLWGVVLEAFYTLAFSSITQNISHYNMLLTITDLPVVELPFDFIMMTSDCHLDELLTYGLTSLMFEN
jgi:hypothetical protein